MTIELSFKSSIDTSSRRQFDVLVDMCSTISSTVSAERVIRSLHAAVKVAGNPAELGSTLFLYDESRRSLVFHSMVDGSKDQAAQLSRHDLRFELVTHSVVRQICLRGRPDILNYRQADHLSRQLLDRLDTDQLLLAPMVSRGQLYGLLALTGTETEKLAATISDRFLQALVYLGAVALERINLEANRKHRPDFEIDYPPDEGTESDMTIQNSDSGIAAPLAESLIDDCRDTINLSESLLELAADERNLADRQNCLMSLGATFRQFRERIELAAQVLDCSSDSNWFCFASAVEHAVTLARETAGNAKIPIEVSVPDDRKMFYGARQLLSLGLSQLIKFLTRTSNDILSLQIRVESEKQQFRIRLRCQFTGDQPASAIHKILGNLVQCHYDRLVAESMALSLIERAGGKFKVLADSPGAILINMEFPIGDRSNAGQSHFLLSRKRWSKNILNISQGT